MKIGILTHHKVSSHGALLQMYGLQQVLQAAKQAGIVESDAQISVRDGKTVIPVSAANKRKLAGFIHDESATGRTFYVEPVEVVELNNELRELEYAERREVVRI